MIGGGLAEKSKSLVIPFIGSTGGEIVGFIMGIATFFLKAYVIQRTYNKIWPKLVTNSGQSDEKFTPLNFEEALLVVVLFS